MTGKWLARGSGVATKIFLPVSRGDRQIEIAPMMFGKDCGARPEVLQPKTGGQRPADAPPRNHHAPVYVVTLWVTLLGWLRGRCGDEQATRAGGASGVASEPGRGHRDSIT